MFKPIASGDIPHAIVMQIRALMGEGKLEPGDKLPGERQLMQQFAVGRSSLREALRTLEATGFVNIIPGKGTFILQPSVHIDLTLESMMRSWINDPETITDLFEVRSLLEVEAAGLAAERASPEDTEDMRAELDKLISAVAVRDIKGMADADLAFHRAIFLATRNNILISLVDSIANSLRDSRVFAFRLSGGHTGTVPCHQMIFEEIKSGDAKSARSAMASHLAESQRFLLLYLAGLPDIEDL